MAATRSLRVADVRAGLSQSVRKAVLAESSRAAAAAVAGAQQLLAQAFVVDDPLADLFKLLLPCAATSAGGPQLGPPVTSSGFPSLEFT